MMNTCESAFKDRKTKRAQVIDTLEPKRRRGMEDCLGASLRGQQIPSVNSRHLTQRHLLSGTWKPCISPTTVGKPTARKADGGAGLGCRKKRMPRCNGEDTGFNVTRLRKQAHVRLVFRCKIIWRTFCVRKSK
jgi:hypothetical protein